MIWKNIFQLHGLDERDRTKLKRLLRVAGGRNTQPSAAVLDGRPLQSTPESGAPATVATRAKTAARFMAVDTLGLLPNLLVTPADEQERRQVEAFEFLQNHHRSFMKCITGSNPNNT